MNEVIFSIKFLCFYGMTIVSLMTWNHFPLPGEDIMLLLGSDFFPPCSVISSSPKCQKCPEKRKQGTLKPFSQNILSRAFLSFFFLVIIFNQDNILLCLLSIIPFSTFGNWGHFFLYFTKRGCEVTEKYLDCLLVPQSTHGQKLQRVIGAL